MLVRDFVTTVWWVWPTSPAFVDGPPGILVLLGLIVRPTMIRTNWHQLGSRSRSWSLNKNSSWGLNWSWSWNLLGLFGLLRRLSLGWRRLRWFEDHYGLNRTVSFVAEFVHKLLRIVTNHLDDDCISLLIVQFVSYFLFLFLQINQKIVLLMEFRPFSTTI